MAINQLISSHLSPPINNNQQSLNITTLSTKSDRMIRMILPLKKRYIEQQEPLDLTVPPQPHPVSEKQKAKQRRQKIKLSGKYTCLECKKSFVQMSSLITHQRIHTGERPYKCKDCNNTYGDLSTFTKHRRIHSGEKPYKCRICSRAFSQSGNCLRHVRSVHKS